MKNRILPCLLLALLAATFARAQQDYYLLGDDTSGNNSWDGNGSAKGWAYESGGPKKTAKADDATGVYHVDGHLFRVDVSGRIVSDPYVFGGGMLVLDGSNPAINAKIKAENKTPPNSQPVLSIGRLSVPSGVKAELRGGNANTTTQFAGTNWVVEAGAFLGFNLGDKCGNNAPYYPRHIVCDAAVSGEGTLAATMGINDSRGNYPANGATSEGSVTLTGDLSAFAGVLSAGENGTMWSGDSAAVVSKISLVIGAAQAMPQSSPGGALLRGAMVVTNGATLSVTCDATSPANRGWTFGSRALPTVDVASGKTATIEGPVEGTAGFAKTGPGTLVLNVGGAGEYGTMTLAGEQTVSDAQLSDYVARCEAWIAGTPWIESAALATEPSETSATFAVEATALGRGAATAALSAILTPEGGTATEVPLAPPLFAPTNGTFSITGLDPDTSYGVSIVLASAAGAVTNVLPSFSTPAANPVPTATLAVESLFGTEAVLSIAVPRFGYGATALSSLVLRWGTDSSDESGWTSVALPLPASEGALQTYRLTGLASGTPHYAKVDVANDLSPARSFTTEVLSFTPSTLEVAGAARVFDVGQDRVAVFTNRAETMTITVPAATTVELLLVGGGGGGGSYVGGGGGGGGFLHLENAVLDAGTYTVSIGAGGAPAATTSYAGNDGGDTVLSLGSETKYIAHGGGGGGGNKDATQRAGRSGASGGGAGNQSTAGGASTATGGERGNPGGGNTTANKGLTLASGGGGAGTPGSHAEYGNGIGGAGGDGLPCSITGEEVWYAGGGGAGGNDQAQGGIVYLPGLGGCGGGGMGCVLPDDYVYDRNRGVDGLGGGGGGGRREGNTGVGRARMGAPGGSGTLIVRWKATPDAMPRATVGSVSGSVGGALVTGSVELGGESGATIEIAVALAGAPLGAWQAIGSDLAAGEGFSLPLQGLADGTAYDYGVRVRSGSTVGEILGAATGSFTTAAAHAVPALLDGDPEGATKTTAGIDSIYAFSAPGTYAFTVAEGGQARFLMVAGGGAGGTQRGGGGGAGGFLELQAATLEAGSYTVVVGAGGAVNAAAGAGGDGADTVLSRDGTEVLRVHGGGGGGGKQSVMAAGNSGGSGGGANPCSDAVAASTAVSPELGNPGGKGSGSTANGKNSAAAGGGGAGGPGADGQSSDIASGSGRRQAGNGGAGVSSDITGETRWYAGGGGGGTWYDANGGYKGLGGSGVGGDGGGYTAEVNKLPVLPTAGADGTGSGGGGGLQTDAGAAVADERGAAGGCGAFILRVAARGVPVVEIESAAASVSDATAAEIAVALRSAGAGGVADVSLAYGTSPESLPLSAPVASGAGPGLFAATVSGLAPGRTWYFTPVANSTTGAIASVALPAAAASPGADGARGLWQTQLRGTEATFRDLFTNATLWASAQGSNLVSGAIAANVGTTYFADPSTGQTFAWAGNWSLFAYRGWIYLEGGRTYTFGSRFADCAYVAVDGRVVVSSYAAVKADVIGSFATTEPGWHEIDARVGRTTVSSWGPDGDGISSWLDFGLAVSADGLFAPTPVAEWTPLVDPGDGSLLRPSKPAARPVQLTGAAANGTTLSLSGLAGAGEAAARAYVVYGDADAGTRTTNAWARVKFLDDVAAANAAVGIEAAVAGWGSTAKVARLVLETDGVFAWSDPATFAGAALPTLDGAHLVDATNGSSATFGATLSGGAGPYTATLYAGASDDELAVVATSPVAAAGPFAIEATDLPAGSTIRWRLAVTDAAGATAVSETFSAKLPGASVLSDSTAGTVAAWNAANPFANRQRTIVASGVLEELGAGETTVFLLRDQTPDGFPAASGTKPHEGEELVVRTTGTYTLPFRADWDQDVTFNWGVSNATGTASWGMTSEARDSKGWARNVTVVDATAYTWTDGAAGSWTDAASWSADGVWGDDVAGYPRRGSYAIFPAGTTAVVSVPDSDSPHRFSRLELGAGADVTFSPAAGATGATLRLQGESNVSSARAYGFSQAANSTLRFSGEGLDVDLRGNWSWHPIDAGTTLEITDGARACLGADNSKGSWSGNGKERSLFAVRNGADVTTYGYIRVSGISSQMVLDDATVSQPYPNSDNTGIWLNGRSMAGQATLVIRGTNAVFTVGHWFQVTKDDTPDTTQYVDFEVPEGGWFDAPIRTDPANTYKFGQGSTTGYKIVLRVPVTSPAVVAGESLDVPLVRWPKGVDTTFVTLDSANLPHPATDRFRTEVDPATGHTVILAHIVGYGDADEPFASGFRLASLAQDSATGVFEMVPGASGGAWLATDVSATVLDGAGDPVPGATATVGLDTVSAYATNTFAVSGLATDTEYTLRVTLDDRSHDPVSFDFPFQTLADWGEGESDTAASVEADGPFTLWTFTNTAANVQTFTVTKAGVAEILVVGGGGAGGAGQNGDNFGGGGGGGGQVVATNLVLLPGTYSVEVGEGGAIQRSRVAGTSGKGSSFGGIVALGGGGGGYNAAGLAGASGGGGASGKAGGAASAGFAGGAGVKDGGGGGGGGAGSAGTAAVGRVPGDGGAGVTNAITGVERVYGAGGGGGGSGTYGSYLSHGGAAGADTAGVGGSRTLDGRQPEAVAAHSATPGFGGGGGGGCASNTADDSSAGNCWGGAGGNGVVIVRMRTTGAADPAPQIAIRSAEAGEGSWTANLLVYELGAGAAEVAAVLRVARNGAAETNDISMGTILATGATNLVANGLAPDSDYAGELVFDNGNAGGRSVFPVEFRTLASPATTVPAGAVWEYGNWKVATSSFSTTSLISGKSPAVTVASTGESISMSNPANTTDRADDHVPLVANRTLEWTWDSPVYLTAFRVFFKDNSNKGSVNVASVEALGADGTWTVISPGPGHYYDTANAGANRGFLVPAAGADVLWVEAAYGIRFTSDAFIQVTDYHNLREVEAEGIPVDETPADLSISILNRTEEGVKATLAFSHSLQANATVKAFVGATHGGTDESAWTLAASEAAAAGAGSQKIVVAAAALAGKNYLRFDYVDANGAIRWSETVYLPDVEILSDIPPTVVFGGVSATTPGSATIVAVLADAGSGAIDEQADLSVRYALSSNAVEAATPVLLAANAPEGETTASLGGLMPGRDYWAQVVATNAAGDAGVSDVFAFSTAPDAVGGGIVSPENVWDPGTWSTATVSLEDNLLRGKTASVDAFGADTTAKNVGVGNLTDGVAATDSKRCQAGSGTVLRFELGGVYELSEFRIYQYSGDAGQRTISVRSLEWRDEAGEWHPLAGSSLEFDGGSYNCASFRPAAPGGKLAVGATAFRYTQGDGGSQSYHFISEMELFGEQISACRVLTVDAASWSGGALSATVSRPVSNAVGRIRAVSGADYHGMDAAAWAADGNDAPFGDLAANEDSVSGSFAPTAGSRYVRFYETDGNGDVVAWSDTIPADPAAVRVADGGVDPEGSRATFFARVVAAGNGALSLVLQLAAADDEDFTNATEIAVANPAVGPVSVAATVEPGASYRYRWIAESGGVVDETPAAVFAARGGSVLAPAVSSSSVANRSAVLVGSLETLGAGETTLQVLAGDSPDALEVVEERTLLAEGTFAVRELFTGAPRTIYYAFRTVNSAGGETWESWSATNSLKTVDNVTYTWKKEKTEGAWNDPANWTPNAYADTCTGYPDHENATVEFLGGTTAAVSVPGKYRFGSWSIGQRNNVDLTFVGEGADVSGLTGGNIMGGDMSNCRWTFAALEVYEINGIEFGQKSDVSKGRDTTVTLTDGAVLRFKEYGTGVYGTNMWLVVEKGSSIDAANKGAITDASIFGGIRLDDGTIRAAHVRTHSTFPQTRGQSLFVSGETPRIILSGSFHNLDGTAENAQNDDSRFLFTVPEGGWTNAVIHSEGETERFAALVGAGPGRYLFEIDPKSRARHTPKIRIAQLVAWKGGVATDNVAFVDPPAGVEFVWTYGWPTKPKADPAEGEVPTGIRAVFRGDGGTLLIFR